MRNGNLILIGFLSLFFLILSPCYAAEKISCLPTRVKTENKNIILPGPEKQNKQQTTEVYFIKNVSEKSLWIEHPVTHPSASAGWSSYLRPGNWAAIILNRKNFSLRCAVIQPGKVDDLNCVNVLSICTPQSVTISPSRKGSYWLAEDKSWEELINLVEKRGVKLP